MRLPKPSCGTRGVSVVKFRLRIPVEFREKRSTVEAKSNCGQIQALVIASVCYKPGMAERRPPRWTHHVWILFHPGAEWWGTFFHVTHIPGCFGPSTQGCCWGCCATREDPDSISGAGSAPAFESLPSYWQEFRSLCKYSKMLLISCSCWTLAKAMQLVDKVRMFPNVISSSVWKCRPTMFEMKEALRAQMPPGISNSSNTCIHPQVGVVFLRPRPHFFLPALHSIAFCRYFAFYKMQVCGSSALTEPLDNICPVGESSLPVFFTFW